MQILKEKTTSKLNYETLKPDLEVFVILLGLTYAERSTNDVDQMKHGNLKESTAINIKFKC